MIGMNADSDFSFRIVILDLSTTFIGNTRSLSCVVASTEFCLSKFAC